MQIALFGTSADPPTMAHQDILVWLSHHFDKVAVWASDNPFKTHQTPLEHRMQMLWLLIEAIEPPRQNIQLYPDLTHPRAIETVRRAKEHWHEADFTLIIGSDLIPQLPRWERVEELMQQVKLLVIPRPSYDIKETDLATLRSLGAELAIANISGLPVSSTAYRETCDSEMLAPPIEEYVYREKLYACQNGAPKNLTVSGHSPTSRSESTM